MLQMICYRIASSGPALIAAIPMTLIMLGGCDDGAGVIEKTTPTPAIATSNAYLAAAVHDLIGDDEPVLGLAGPGMCPGHFDLRPSQIDELRGCALLLRFDFQRGLDRKLGQLIDGGLQIIEIEGPAGLCAPSAYVQTCRAVGDALVTSGLLPDVERGRRLAHIEKRVNRLITGLRDRMTGNVTSGIRVVASHRQEVFSEFLGLTVVATFSGADTALASEIDAAVEEQDVRLVIANRPEGRRLADALGERLGVPVVVFDNFPDPDRHHGRFDALLTDNVDRLLAALAQ